MCCLLLCQFSRPSYPDQCCLACLLLISRYITTEELEQALKKYNMGDEKTIREIIAEVDTDNVLSLVYNDFSILPLPPSSNFMYRVFV